MNEAPAEPPNGTPENDGLPELKELRWVPGPDLERSVLESIRRRESVAFAVGFVVEGVGAMLRAIVDWAGTVIERVDKRGDEEMEP